MKITTTQTNLGDGASEIGCRNAAGELIAVITHPCEGAKWFVHRMGDHSHPREKYATRKAAIAAISGK